MIDTAHIFGTIAAICTTTSFIPQVVKVWQTKSTGDISLGMFILFTIGVISWLIYGILLNELPIILANTATFFLVCI